MKDSTKNWLRHILWVGLAWLWWLWQSGGRVWPRLRGQPEWRLGGWWLWQGQRLVLIGYVGLAVDQWLRGGHGVAGAGGTSPLEISLGCGGCGRREPWVQVEPHSDGGYRAELWGHFRLQVAGDEPFRMRLLILLRRRLEVAGPERVIGRSRDDRAPFVRQVPVAQWLGLPQPKVSRWERYWLAGNWPDLLSEKTVELLTAEVRSRIVPVLAAFPWWGLQQVHPYLQEHGPARTYRPVRQVAEESGFSPLRQALQSRTHLRADRFRPQDDWLGGQLLALVESLLAQVEAGQGLTPQQQISLTQMHTLAVESGLTAQPPLKVLPWLLRVEQLLFGQWQTVVDEQIRCIYGGSTHVVPKSRQSRRKKYYDAQGQGQMVAL